MVTEADLPVAVIGGGGSGLLAAAALCRSGVAFELLEARPGIGGTWRYDETGTGSACYASLVANTSNALAKGRRRLCAHPQSSCTTGGRRAGAPVRSAPPNGCGSWSRARSGLRSVPPSSERLGSAPSRRRGRARAFESRARRQGSGQHWIQRSIRNGTNRGAWHQLCEVRALVVVHRLRDGYLGVHVDNGHDTTGAD
jgi:hypothetical protein